MEPNFLIVDENEINIKILVKLLSRYSGRKEIVSCEEEWLKVSKDPKYDVVFISDTIMTMDRTEIIRQIDKRNMQSNKGKVCVAVSAEREPDKEQYFREGFQEVLSCPVKPQVLRQLLKNCLSEQKWYAASEDLPDIEGIDWRAGMSHFPNKRRLKDSVKDFYKVIDSQGDALNNLFNRLKKEEGARREYRTKVHAMKSMARLIGASELGQKAFELENAAGADDWSFVEASHGAFVEEWCSFKDKLQIFAPEVQDENKKPIEDALEVIAYLEMLRVALAQMNIEEADAMMEKLWEYRYPEEIHAYMERLNAFVTNLESEQAALLIEQITAKIT